MSKPEHYILYDSSCSQCSDIAADIERATGGLLLGESLYARRAKDWLDKARPGWKFEPTLIEFDGNDVRAYTGLAMRARMLTFLNPLQLLKLVRVVQQAGIPLFGAFEAHEPHELEAPDAIAETIETEPTPAHAEPAKAEMPLGFRMTSDGPAVGENATVASLTTTKGTTITLNGGGEENTVLLFLSTTCGFCRAVAAYVAEFAQTAPERIVLVFSSVEPDALSEFISENNLADLPITISPETRSGFGVTGIPYAFALDSHGIVRGKGIVNNSDHLDSLANTFYISVAAFKQALAYRKEERVDVIYVGMTILAISCKP